MSPGTLTQDRRDAESWRKIYKSLGDSTKSSGCRWVIYGCCERRAVLSWRWNALWQSPKTVWVVAAVRDLRINSENSPLNQILGDVGFSLSKTLMLVYSCLAFSLPGAASMTVWYFKKFYFEDGGCHVFQKVFTWTHIFMASYFIRSKYSRSRLSRVETVAIVWLRMLKFVKLKETGWSAEIWEFRAKINEHT